MNILFVDDNKDFINDLKKRVFIFISNYNDRTSSHVYHKYTSKLLETKYHLAFIDIDLADDNVNGIIIAEKIKELNPACYIVFVSARNDLMHSSLRVQPFYFIRKTNYIEDLDIFFDLFCDKMYNFDILQLTYLSKSYTVSSFEILYLEAYQHITCIHTQDDIFYDKRSLKQFCSILSKDFFVQIHRSLIINLRYMTNFTSSSVCINNNDEFKIGRTYKELCQSKIKEFLLK